VPSHPGRCPRPASWYHLLTQQANAPVGLRLGQKQTCCIIGMGVVRNPWVDSGAPLVACEASPKRMCSVPSTCSANGVFKSDRHKLQAARQRIRQRTHRLSRCGSRGKRPWPITVNAKLRGVHRGNKQPYQCEGRTGQRHAIPSHQA
jgi:hypothetical protein